MAAALVFHERIIENDELLGFKFFLRQISVYLYSYRNSHFDFIEIAIRYACSPVNLLHIFRTPFLKNTSGWILLLIAIFIIRPTKSDAGYLNSVYYVYLIIRTSTYFFPCSKNINSLLVRTSKYGARLFKFTVPFQ